METMEDLLQRKEEGRGFYHHMGAQSSNAEIRRLCGMLAEDEMRQERVLLALRRGKAPQLEGSLTLDEAKGILRKLSLDDPCSSGLVCEVVRLDTAMEYEARCVRICREIADAVEGPQRELFLRMAAEEEVHYTLLEQMRDVVHGALC